MALNVRARLRKRKRAPQHIITFASVVRAMFEINAGRVRERDKGRGKECVELAGKPQSINLLLCFSFFV